MRALHSQPPVQVSDLMALLSGDTEQIGRGSRMSEAKEPRERSGDPGAPASDRVGESEGRSPSEEENDFAALFEASLKAKRFEKGQTIEGTIVAIGPEVAFVDVGGKGEAVIEIDELKDDDGNLEVAVGDRIQATVVSTLGGLTLSRKLALGAATARQLEDAFRSGLAVEGKVERAVKGGYEVRVARQRAFCPISQIDTIRNTDPSQHEGRVYR